MLWSLFGLPLVVGVALLLAGHRADHHAAVVSITTSVVTLGMSIAAAIIRPAMSVPYLRGITFGLRVDGLSAVLVVTVAVVTLAVLVFAAGEFGAGEAQARYHGLMLVFASAMLLTVTATTLVTLLMAWEVMSAMSYALIGFHWRQRRRAASGTVAFLVTRAADLGLYVAAGAALAGGASGLTLDALAGLPDGWRDVVAGGVILAAAGKSAQLPFSFWLARAMDGPSSTSALLHSATMVAAGSYLLLRLEPLLAATPWAPPLVAWLGAITALALGAVAVVQTDLKQLLAASTCSQVGFMVLAAGAGGVAAGSAQLVAHALTKSLLFLTAGAWLMALGTKHLPDLTGVARRYPVVGTTFTVGAVTLAGLPPLSLWATKDQVLTATVPSAPALYLVGLAAAALSAAYAMRAVTLVWSPPTAEPRFDTEHPGTRRVSRAQSVVLPPLASGAALLGVLAVPGVWSAFARLVSHGREATPEWWEAAVSAAVALAAAAAAVAVVRLRGDVPEQGGLLRWLGLEAFARERIARPAVATGQVLARFDDQVVAGAVRGTATLGLRLARMTTLRWEPVVGGAVRGVAGGVRRLGHLARRPQTGQLHQYYAEIAVLLTALVVLLIVL